MERPKSTQVWLAHWLPFFEVHEAGKNMVDRWGNCLSTVRTTFVAKCAVDDEKIGICM